MAKYNDSIKQLRIYEIMTDIKKFKIVKNNMIAILQEYIKHNNKNDHVKLLFYLFGWILIITANWDLFFHESIALKKITGSLK